MTPAGLARRLAAAGAGLRRRAAAALALGLALSLTSGCALLGPDRDDADRQAAEAAATADAAPGEGGGSRGVQVEIDAPAELRTLLLRYLDLVRLGRLARGDVDDTEWSRLIQAAPAQVRELLQTEGYFSPQVSVRREDPAARADGRPETVHVTVQPGERARVSRVTLEVEGALERAAAAGDADAQRVLRDWRSAWALPAGRVFRNPLWSEAKARALAQLRAEGYASATWSGTAADADPAQSSVRLFVVADSGPLYRLGTLEIEGLVAHDVQTVRNLLASEAGVPVTESLLLDFQERLVKAGLFDSATVTLETEPEGAAQSRIVARLKEAPLQAYTAGLGYSANNGARASLEGLFRRPFGLAAIARLKTEIGQQRQLFEGEVSTHPLQRLQRWLIGGAFDRQVSDTDTVVSQRLRLGRAQDRTSLDRLYFAEFERSLRTTGAGARTDVSALSANFHGTWRELDNVILPTRGYTVSAQLGAGRAHSSTADDGEFVRAWARLTGYVPLGASWYGQGRVEFGRVFTRRGVALPESQKWRAGGDESVRGYDFRSLGPRDDAGAVTGGKAIVTASVEVARPILARLPSLWGAAFIDAGQAADDVAALRPVLGYGVGVRWRSPVGPLRLDWAWGQAVRRGRIHFSVGIAF